MKIQESAEDYLETILSLRRRNGTVRSIDIVEEMNFSKPSVSVAMKKLRTSGHIEMDEHGYITLTPSGEEIAQRIQERHEVFSKMLIDMGVDPDTAAHEACKMEHVISDDTFQKIKAHIKEDRLLRREMEEK